VPWAGILPQSVSAGNKDHTMNEVPEKSTQIGALAKQLGITTRTIRYYEEIGLMGKVDRQGGSTRSYNHDEILRLKFILKMKSLGISLKEIQELSNIFDINDQDFTTITPKLIEILDHHIAVLDEKMVSLMSLRQDVVEYRLRIMELLSNGAP
jgi:DNA-binding transcriptional MerR regulator